MRELIIGYLFLIIGISGMGFSFYNVYSLFTGETKPYVVFEDQKQDTKKPSFTTQDLLTNPSAITEMQTNLLSGILEKQMNKTINMGATVFLYYFLMLFGFRIATLGVMLIRPLKVKIRSKVIEVDETPEEKKTPAKVS